MKPHPLLNRADPKKFSGGIFGETTFEEGDQMAAKKEIRQLPPAGTPEARENQLISLAVDLAEKKLLDGTASSQILIHYLKLGSTRMELEKEKIRKENILLEAKAGAIESSKRTEELFQKALEAMREYGGGSND